MHVEINRQSCMFGRRTRVGAVLTAAHGNLTNLLPCSTNIVHSHTVSKTALPRDKPQETMKKPMVVVDMIFYKLLEYNNEISPGTTTRTSTVTVQMAAKKNANKLMPSACECV